jgi:hypothetical protein
LLPLVLFPLTGVLKATEVAPNYFRVLIIKFIFDIFCSILKDTTSFFFGSITLGYAIQRVNLHRRVALFVLTLVGSSVGWFVFDN